MKIKKVVSLLMCTIMALSMVACGETEGSKEVSESTKESSSVQESSADSEAAAEPKEVVTLSFGYTGHAKYESSAVPFLEKLLEEEVGVKMDVWVNPDGDAEKQTSLASGDFADIIIWMASDDFDTCVEAGYLIDLAQYKDQLPAVFENPLYEGAIQYKMDRYGDGEHLYSLPMSLGTNQGSYAYSPSIRWDVYEDIGTPDIPDWDTFLDVLEDMVEAYPKTSDGLPTYAITMDTNLQNFWLNFVYLRGAYLDVTQLAAMAADGSSIEKTLVTGSPLYEAAQWVFEANQRGLLDPDGGTQAPDSAQSKVANGQIMYVPFTWWGTTTYNTLERTNVDDYEGYAQIYPECFVVPGASDAIVGGERNLAISTSCENIDAALAYINWLYSDGVELVLNGPEGYFWEYDADGNQVPTDTWYAVKGRGEEISFPDGGTMTELANILTGVAGKIVTDYTINPETGLTMAIAKRDAFQIEKEYTKLEQSWLEYTEGEDNLYEKYMNTDRTMKQTAAVNMRNAVSDEATQIATDLKTLTSEAIVKMVYAKDQAEFDKIWNQLLEDADALNYDLWYTEYSQMWKDACEFAGQYVK